MSFVATGCSIRYLGGDISICSGSVKSFFWSGELEARPAICCGGRSPQFSTLPVLVSRTKPREWSEVSWGETTLGVLQLRRAFRWKAHACRCIVGIIPRQRCSRQAWTFAMFGSTKEGQVAVQAGESPLLHNVLGRAREKRCGWLSMPWGGQAIWNVYVSSVWGTASCFPVPRRLCFVPLVSSDASVLACG